MHRRRPGRRLALASAAVLLGSPLLAACGFNYATDRVNTNAAGVTDRSGVVDVVGVNVVAGADGAGNLIGNLSNGGDDDDALVDVEGADGSDITATPFDPVELTASGSVDSTVNLADLVEKGDPISLSGSFGAGEVVPLTLTFESADPITVNVPVLKPCFQYEGLDESPSGKSTKDTPLGGDSSVDPTDGSSDSTDEPSTSESTSADDEDLAGEPDAAYSCEHEPIGGESSE